MKFTKCTLTDHRSCTTSTPCRWGYRYGTPSVLNFISYLLEFVNRDSFFFHEALGFLRVCEFLLVLIIISLANQVFVKVIESRVHGLERAQESPDKGAGLPYICNKYGSTSPGSTPSETAT